MSGSAELPLLALLAGLLLLALGRRLYLLFVALVGFLCGAWLVAQLPVTGVPWLWLGAALLLGALGALFALVAQKMAVAVAGFLLGGAGIFWLLDTYRISLEGAAWLVPPAVAVVSSLLLLAIFDVALVVLSSLLGAVLVVSALLDVTAAPGLPALVLFVVLLTLGVAIQTRSLKSAKERESAEAS